MTNLLILVKMQLKEQFNIRRKSLKDVSVFKIVISVLTEILKFALVTVLCGAFLFMSSYLGLFSVTNTVPASVLSMVFYAMLAVSIVSCTVGLTNSLYLARDNAVLLTLPCTPIQVYLSKLIIFFIFELKRNLSFIVPLFFAYYYLTGYPVAMYLWFLVCTVLISFFTVSLGALLSIPGMYIANMFRQRKLLQGIVLATAVTAVTVALFTGIAMIPENIDLVATWQNTCRQVQNVLAAYEQNFAVLYNLSKMMLGDKNIYLITFPVGRIALRALIVLGVSGALFGSGLLCAQPLFYKMASKPLEHLKRRARPKKNVVLPPWLSAIWSEMLTAMKSPDRLFFNVAMLISPSMLIFLLNKIFAKMNTSVRGDNMVVAFNILVILLLVLNANTYASSIYSRDGRSSYLIKTQPTKYYMLLVAKLVPSTLFVGASLIGAMVIMFNTLALPTGSTVMLIVGIVAVYLAHLFFCAELDLMNPKYQLYASMGASENNPNEATATVTAFLLAFGIAVVMFLLMTESASSFVFVKFLVVALAALVWRTTLFFRNIKLYYKEK